MTTTAERAKELSRYVAAEIDAGGLDVGTLEALLICAFENAQNDKLEEAERAILNEHSVAESADLNIGLLRAARAVKALRLSTPEKD